jgi:hypothetical protein
MHDKMQLENLRRWQESICGHIDGELTAFGHLLPGLLSTHKGQFVAVYNSNIIDRDSDEFLLAERVARQSLAGPVLIQQITEVPCQEFLLETT